MTEPLWDAVGALVGGVRGGGGRMRTGVADIIVGLTSWEWTRAARPARDPRCSGLALTRVPGAWGTEMAGASSVTHMCTSSLPLATRSVLTTGSHSCTPAGGTSLTGRDSVPSGLHTRTRTQTKHKHVNDTGAADTHTSMTRWQQTHANNVDDKRKQEDTQMLKPIHCTHIHNE